MLDSLKNLSLLLSFPKRRRLELEKQKREGYSAEMPSGSRGECVIYREGEKELEAALTWDEECRLFTSSLKKWRAPVKGQELTQDEFERALKRIKEFLLIHTTNVILDDSPERSYEDSIADMKSILEGAGWDWKEEGGKTIFFREEPKR